LGARQLLSSISDLVTAGAYSRDELLGVVLAGGSRTRLDPLTRAVNKHLLPVWNRPMVYYPIEALVRCGISHVALVTNTKDVAAFELQLRTGADLGLQKLDYATQTFPGGVAQAVHVVEGIAAGRPLIVLLGDNIFEYSLEPTVAAFTRDSSQARLVLSEVSDVALLRELGVAAFSDDGTVTRLLEKPTSPPSHHAVTGAYCYGPGIFDVISELSPSERDEYEVTDVNNILLAAGVAACDVAPGYWIDAGASCDALHQATALVRLHGANKPYVGSRTATTTA
jgi:glucose-1-phosphate thymidylyltransferase